MSLAIKFGDTSDTSSLSGFIYFDVVTDYTRKLSGKLTSHPLDAGALISDHYISENKKFNIKGVFTGADISGTPNMLNIEGLGPFNTNVQPIALTVSDQGAGLEQYLPASITQFLGVTAPEVIVDESSRVDYKGQIWTIFDKLMTALVYDKKSRKLKSQMSVITLYELDGIKLEKQYDNFVITDFSVDEDGDSGEGMFFNMSLESATFVTLEKVDLPKDVADSLKKSAAPKASKAKVSGDTKVADGSKDAPSIEKKPRTHEQNAAERAAIWSKK